MQFDENPGKIKNIMHARTEPKGHVRIHARARKRTQIKSRQAGRQAGRHTRAQMNAQSHDCFSHDGGK